MLQNLIGLWESTGVYKMLYNAGVFQDDFYKTLIMYAIVAVLMYLAIGKKFEPLLMVGIAFGCLLSNLPEGGLCLNVELNYDIPMENCIAILEALEEYRHFK